MTYLRLSISLSGYINENHYMELDDDRWQIKILIIRDSGEVLFAYDDIENGTFWLKHHILFQAKLMVSMVARECFLRK